MRLQTSHISAWFYVISIVHEGMWASISELTHFCTVLQANSIITQQAADHPVFTFSTLSTEQSLALVVSRLTPNPYEKTFLKYIATIDWKPEYMAKLLLATPQQCEHIVTRLSLHADLAKYRHYGPIFRKEYSILLLQSILHARSSIALLLYGNMLPESITMETFKFLYSHDPTSNADDSSASSAVFTQIASYFTKFSFVAITHIPYANPLNLDSSFIVRTINPYLSILHISRGIGQVIPPNDAKLTNCLQKIPKSMKAWFKFESGCTLSLKILSSHSAETLIGQYPQFVSYQLFHHLFSPSIVLLTLPYYNINRVFSILTQPHVPMLPTDLSSKETVDLSNTLANCPSTFALKPALYLEFPKRLDIRNTRELSIWLTSELHQPLSRVGCTYAPYVVLSSAFSTHTLSPSDAKGICEKLKTVEQEYAMYICQGRLATDVTSTGAIVGDIGMLTYANIKPPDSSYINEGHISLADAALPSHISYSMRSDVASTCVGIGTPIDTVVAFANKASVLEQQFSVVHGLYDDLYIAVTAGIPAHSLENTNIFYCLTSEDSWRSYQLECFRYWNGAVPYADISAAKLLSNYQVYMRQEGEASTPLISLSAYNCPSKLSKKTMARYLSAQKEPLSILAFMKRSSIIDGHWTLQQQVILYTAAMQKRFVMSTRRIYLLIRLHYPLLNLRIIRIETARVLTPGQFVSILILVEDLNLSMKAYLKALGGSISFTHVPPSSQLPRSSVYHCLVVCSFDGGFVGLQPLLLGGLGQYYGAYDKQYLELKTFGLPAYPTTNSIPWPATVAFETAFPIYVGPLISSSYSYLLSDVSAVAASTEFCVYLCLRSIHSILVLNALTGEKTIIGVPHVFTNPYSIRFLVSPNMPLPIFNTLTMESIWLPATASTSVAGDLLSDHTDTEVAELLNRPQGSDDHEAAMKIYTVEESDEIRTPGYCTDTSEGEGDNRQDALSSSVCINSKVKLSLSSNFGHNWPNATVFKPSNLSVTQLSKTYGVSLVRDDKLMTFPHFPIAVSRFKFKTTDLMAVIGQGKNGNCWGFSFTKCHSKGFRGWIRQMVVDLGVPYASEFLPVFNASTEHVPSSSKGKVSTASISCTGDSLIFAIPTKALLSKTIGQMIPVTRLVEIGFYTELRQVTEIAGIYRAHTPARTTNLQFKPIESHTEN